MPGAHSKNEDSKSGQRMAASNRTGGAIVTRAAGRTRWPPGMGYNEALMSSSDPMTPEGEAIGRALTRIERRLRLNHAVYAASLIAGLAVLALLTWRALRWIGAAAPRTSTVVIVLALVAATVL